MTKSFYHAGSPNWTEIIIVFLKVGTIGFGGPFALLAILEREVVHRRRWFTAEEFAHSVAIGTLTPGPIFFGAGTHIAYLLRGIPGAAVAGIAMLLPGFVAVLCFAALYFHVQSYPAVVGITHGMTAGVTGLLATMTIRSAKSLSREPVGIALAIACFAAIELLSPNPVWIILLAALVGMVLHRKTAAENKTGPSTTDKQL